MKKLILILFLWGAINPCIAQYTGKDFYLTFGGGLGYPLKEKIDPQNHAVDLYPTLTNYSTQFNVGFGMKVSDKIEVELGYLHNRKSFDDDAYDDAISFRYSDKYLYKRFDNSIEHYPDRFSANIYQVRLNYVITFNKIIITTTLAPGLGKWDQFNYKYILRQKNSNSYTEYELDYKSKIHFIYYVGAKLALKKWPNTRLSLNYTGDRSNHFYTVDSASSTGITNSEKVNFSSYSNIFSLGINFVVTFEKGQ